MPPSKSEGATAERTPKGKPAFLDIDFNEAPFIVIWEVTRACDLKCLHCRAEAIPARNPNELSTEEGYRLLRQVREFGQPLLVLTGGDPIKRPDIYDFISYGDDLGLRMTMTPSGTPLMTPEVIGQCQTAGLMRMAISLDGPTAEVHDTFRGESGSFEWTLNILRWCRDIGLSTQVNTTITRYNIDLIDDLCDLMEEVGISLWSVFFLVPTGRGRKEDEVSGHEYEMVFEKMYELSQHCSFDIKSTAAPHYRRVIMQHKVADRRAARAAGAAATGGDTPAILTPGVGFSVGDGVGRAAKSVNDGNGFVFIDHLGEVYPSGFLPVSGGNVRRESLVDIYRHSDLFVTIRDYSQLKGKCGVCEYRNICGGSRARSYGMFGDYMESEPLCDYTPGPWQKLVDRGEAQDSATYFKERLAARGLDHLTHLVV